MVLAFSRAVLISSVHFPCSVIALSTFSFSSVKLRRYLSLSAKARSVWSSQVPCISFLYRAIKGIVHPSSSKDIIFLLYSSFSPNSCASVSVISIYFFSFNLFAICFTLCSMSSSRLPRHILSSRSVSCLASGSKSN